METTPIATLTNVAGGYVANHNIISNISLRLFTGQLTAIIGPNGAGKSTILRALMGTLPYTFGEISLDRKNSQQLSSRQRAQIVALVSSQMGHTEQTVSQYVMTGRAPHRQLWRLTDSLKDKQIVLNTIEEIGISHLADTPLCKLSDGQRQLTILSRAMAQKPRILLLDEPTANLDLNNQKKILQTIGRLYTSHQMAVVMVVHDINIAAQYADSIAIVKHGTITHYGAPSEILTEETLRETYGVDFWSITSPLSGKKIFIS